MKGRCKKRMFFRKFFILIGLGLGLVILWIVSMEYKVWLAESETFCIRGIEVSGNELLSEKEILQLGGLVPRGSIWQLTLREVEEKIGCNAFIEKVIVERCLPDMLRIRVVEKHPVALISIQGKIYCVDREGLVMPLSLGKRYNLPLLSGGFRGDVGVGGRAGGKAVRQGLNFLLSVLKDRPELYFQISEVVVGEPEGLVLYTSRAGVPVWIGNAGYGWKVRYLEAILDELVRRDELSRVHYIDLRFEGQVVVGMRI